jgi:nucleotide-binding universal stress UspA family protein
MFRSILVPLDGSDFGEQALPLAVSLARRLGAAVQVVHVHTPAWGLYGERPAFYDETLDGLMRKDDREYLDKTVERLAVVADIPLSSALLDGPVVDAIDRHAAASGVDLLVLTTHGRGPLARFWLGSVADALIRQVGKPLLLVPPQEAALDFIRDGLPHRVLVPLDGSELAEQIIEPVAAIGSATGASVRLLRVIQPILPERYPPTSAKVVGPVLQDLESWHRAEVLEAEAYLQEVADRLRSRSLTVETRVVTQEQPAAAILQDASANQVDMIALATQGRGGLKRLLLGSVADKVLRGTTMPVLVYRPVETSARSTA